MKCYRQSGCGPYEMLPCNECPASKPEYLNKYKKGDKHERQTKKKSSTKNK